MREMSRWMYIYVAKPVLFRFSPDAVHTNVAKLARSAQAIAPLRETLSLLWRHDAAMLEQELCGLHFANPVGLSAGFDKNVELEPIIESLGFGFMTAGSVTGYYCAGNEKPWFHRLPKEKSIVVNAGLPNKGSKAIAEQLAHDTRTKQRGIPLCISVARTNRKESSTDEEGVADYVRGVKNLQAYADSIELNISCPNTYGGEPFTDPKRLKLLLDAIDALALKKPVFIKMPSSLPWKEYSALLDEIVKHNVQAVTVSNLRKDRTNVTVDDSVKGNLSGKPTKALSDDLIRKTYQHCGDKLVIIGVGGVFTAADAYAKIKNGASLVALVTGLIYEGPQIAGEINHGLEALLRQDGYTSISQAIGANLRNA